MFQGVHVCVCVYLVHCVNWILLSHYWYCGLLYILSYVCTPFYKLPIASQGFPFHTQLIFSLTKPAGTSLIPTLQRSPLALPKWIGEIMVLSMIPRNLVIYMFMRIMRNEGQRNPRVHNPIRQPPLSTLSESCALHHYLATRSVVLTVLCNVYLCACWSWAFTHKLSCGVLLDGLPVVATTAVSISLRVYLMSFPAPHSDIQRI